MPLIRYSSLVTLKVAIFSGIISIEPVPMGIDTDLGPFSRESTQGFLSRG